jgi:malate dehydrogenase (oxaloacetate-decarboxylating)(NADP+)
MKIPVFHDDQHGTAIVVGAAATNAMHVSGKSFDQIKVVSTGGGAAGIACLEMLVKLGVKRENVWLCDIDGLVYHGRPSETSPQKAAFAQGTTAATLADVIGGADLFLGLSGPGVLTPAMVAKMAPKPIVFALANPTPEILPEEVKAVRPDAVIATGRSDYPNQVNNVLCFPFIFRGALDVGATKITEEMKLACVKAIAELTQAEQSDVVAMAYEGQELSFGPEYIIPKPFDPRLITRIAPAVAKAAMDSGVATRPITDFDAYRQQLTNFVYHSGFVMKPVFAAAKAAPRRVIYAEGEDERVLRAVQVVVDERLANPILIGRPEVVEMRLKRFGLRIKPGKDFELVNPESDARYREVWTEYYKAMNRKGVSPDDAKAHVRQSTTLIGAMLLRRGDGDAMLCGTFGRHKDHLRHIANVIGLKSGASIFAAMNVLLLAKRTLFITDTYVNEDPSVEQLAEITVMAAEEVKRFGVVPRIALLSHSNFGSDDSPSALKMSRARDQVEKLAPDLEVEGEMHGDAALSESIRNHVHPDSRLKGEANLLIMPNLDAANISFNLLKMTGGEGVTVGPILLGAAKAVHILTPTATVRRMVNMTALCVVDANAQQRALF